MQSCETLQRLIMIFWQFSFSLSFLGKTNRSLIESEELSEFIHIKIFLDEDFTSTAKFTVSLPNQSWYTTHQFCIYPCLFLHTFFMENAGFGKPLLHTLFNHRLPNLEF